MALLTHLGLKAENYGPFLTIEGAGTDEIEQRLHEARTQGMPDTRTLAKAVKNKTIEKHDPFLSEALLCLAFASSRFDQSALEL
ncbi:MAG: hypothetical protein LGR52_06970 [Candidatus Thiosymbion ectosymbiont of Robbea hypermnestra]|nr:hypothetical protein [Candidatus Thiosymbion ectosymbiont of Robbea hypermnestra]